MMMGALVNRPDASLFFSTDAEEIVDTRFGKIALQKTIPLPSRAALLGMPDKSRFFLTDFPSAKLAKFKLLQSLEDNSLSFITLPINLQNTLILAEDISRASSELGMSLTHLVTLLIVSVNRTASRTVLTVNARAPLFIDSSLRVAAQYVFPTDRLRSPARRHRVSASVSQPAFLERFVCLGPDCEDTCCKGWNMQVDKRTQALYQAQAPQLLQNITGDADDAIMRRDAKTDYCVTFEGLCGIQRVHGEEFLGDACYFYPRATRALGEQISMTGTLSCPQIVRLALLEEDAFAPGTAVKNRLPQGLQDYLPEGLTTAQAQAIHEAFLNTALTSGGTAARAFMHVFNAALSLSRVTVAAWPDAVPFYLQYAGQALPAPEPRATDPAFLTQALCGLVAAAKSLHHTRLMRTVTEMQTALHISIRWDTLSITALPDSIHATKELEARWHEGWQARYDTLLRRYLAMQLSLALFPFSGFGTTLAERIAIIGIRLATVQLGLMSLPLSANDQTPEAEVVRVIQSLSRFLDHLAGAEPSLKIYGETGWLQGGRLRALLMDKV